MHASKCSDGRAVCARYLLLSSCRRSAKPLTWKSAGVRCCHFRLLDSSLEQPGPRKGSTYHLHKRALSLRDLRYVITLLHSPSLRCVERATTISWTAPTSRPDRRKQPLRPPHLPTCTRAQGLAAAVQVRPCTVARVSLEVSTRLWAFRILFCL